VTGEVAIRHEDCHGAPAPSPTSKMERSDILLVVLSVSEVQP